MDDNLLGQPCDDNDPSTIDDVYTLDCQCQGQLAAKVNQQTAGHAIYPNPFIGQLSVDLKEGLEYTNIYIYDSQGTLVNTINMENHEGGTVNIQIDGQAGFYIMHIETTTGIELRPIMKL